MGLMGSGMEYRAFLSALQCFVSRFRSRLPVQDYSRLKHFSSSSQHRARFIAGICNESTKTEALFKKKEAVEANG